MPDVSRQPGLLANMPRLLDFTSRRAVTIAIIRLLHILRLLVYWPGDNLRFF